MASPANDSYSVASGATLYAGRTGLPAWVTAVAPGRWGTVPGNTLADVDPDPGRTAALAGNSGQSAVVSKWNGACFDAARGRMWLTSLGGHGDYLGNEGYMQDLDLATPAWSMVWAPSDLASYSVASGTARTYSNGRARSTHSYNGTLYVPNYGPALAGLMATSPDGTDDGAGGIVIFDESDGTPTFGANRPYGGGGSTTGVAACFDATRGTAGWMWRRNQGTQAIQRYDIAADTWANVGDVMAWAGSCCMAIHSSGAYLLVGNGDSDGGQTVSGGWCVFDPAGSGGTYYHYPTFVGTVSGGLEPGRCQPVWVPSVGKFCAWDNATDRERITTFEPGADPFTDDWTISYLPVDSGNTVTPPAAQALGTYGRFAHWPAADILLVLNANNLPVNFYRI